MVLLNYPPVHYKNTLLFDCCFSQTGYLLHDVYFDKLHSCPKLHCILLHNIIHKTVHNITHKTSYLANISK